jgi:hypothetical protein
VRKNDLVIKVVCASPKMAYRIEANGKPIAMALALANGRWVLCDMDEHRISNVSYRTPQMVGTAAKRLGMHT